MLITKICTSCGQEKPIAEFHKQTGTKDGYKYRCRDCCKVTASERYSLNKNETVLKVRAWQEKNKDKVRQYKAKWRENHSIKN